MKFSLKWSATKHTAEAYHYDHICAHVIVKEALLEDYHTVLIGVHLITANQNQFWKYICVDYHHKVSAIYASIYVATLNQFFFFSFLSLFWLQSSF